MSAYFVKMFYPWMLLCILISNSLSHAQEVTAPVSSPQESSLEQKENPAQLVEVSNVKDPDWKSYKMMLKGLDAFEKFHFHASRAEHKFILKPRKPELNLSGVSLRLASDDYSRPIALSEDGTFSLPRDAQAEEQKAELLINRKKDLFRWWPLVRSPGVASHQRRLGDLRLECEMFWAIHYDDLPFIARNFVRVLGGPCKTKKVSLAFPVELMGLQSAVLVDGDRRQILHVDPARSTYVPPLYDANFSDDALIEFMYDSGGEQPKRNVNGLNVAVSL